jgi:hypothetical protein
VKTYSRDTFTKARQAWTDGDFGERWEPYRRAAAERGYLFPPAGTKHDDRDVEQPSQRAVIWRAIDFAPDWLLGVVAHSSSWSQVVAAIVGHDTAMREDATLSERDVEADRGGRPTRGQAMESLRSIVGRLP